MKFLSLFAGIGGIDLGLERAGFECVGQVEWDPYCMAVLDKHWPDVPKFFDIKDVTDEQLTGLGRIDVVAGGFPCQPVSYAGKRKGQSDDRWLWPEFARVLRTVRPRVVFVENVPGLLTANAGEAFGEVEGDLATLGYDSEWTRVSAASLGAPHLRKRIALVAWHTDTDDDVTLGIHARGARTLHEQLGAVPDADSDTDGNGREIKSQSDGERFAVSQTGKRGDDPDRLRDDVPDADGVRRYEGKRDLHAREFNSVGGGEELADAYTFGRDGRPRVFREGGRRELENSHWWTVEPDVGRVAHGVPKRVDRLKSLGNAVVPQFAEYVGWCIREAFFEHDPV